MIVEMEAGVEYSKTQVLFPVVVVVVTDEITV
jgi:hypothetical protein